MKPKLFPRVDYKKDRHTPARDALNAIAGGNFFSAVEYWLKGIGYGNDGGSCIFPEDDDDFEGVLCYNYWDEEVLLSEEEFFSLLKEACQRYIELHPDRRDKLEQIMSQSILA